MSQNGFLGGLFIISDSASSYAKAMAGTYITISNNITKEKKKNKKIVCVKKKSSLYFKFAKYLVKFVHFCKHTVNFFFLFQSKNVKTKTISLWPSLYFHKYTWICNKFNNKFTLGYVSTLLGLSSRWQSEHRHKCDRMTKLQSVWNVHSC